MMNHDNCTFSLSRSGRKWLPRQIGIGIDILPLIPMLVSSGAGQPKMKMEVARPGIAGIADEAEGIANLHDLPFLQPWRVA